MRPGMNVSIDMHDHSYISSFFAKYQIPRLRSTGIWYVIQKNDIIR